MIIAVLFYIFFVISAIMVLILFVETCSAVFLSSKKCSFSGISKSVAILVPAHNEEAVVAKTIESIKPQLKKNDRLIVIADNCTDRTEDAATNLGAEVIVRNDNALKGKGYALDFAIQYLSNSPPDVVIIIDADCIISENYVSKMIAVIVDANSPVQSLNLVKNHSQPQLQQKIAEFAFAFKNKVRVLGKRNIVPCCLTGTGMGFPWQLINKMNLATSNIVEDIKLSIEMVSERKYPIFYSEVAVTSVFPNNPDSLNTQKTRWEHGHLEIILKLVPVALLSSLKSRNLKLFLFALDLAIPPLALFTVLNCLLLLISGLLSFFTDQILYFSMMLTLMSFYMFAIFISWWKFGREIITLYQLIYVPIYIIKKISIYLKFIIKKEKNWVRTDRD